MNRIYFLATALFLCSGLTYAQPRPAELSSKPVALGTAKAAPVSFEAKYEGGMFGYSEKQAGMLKFDDDNRRLVFFGKDQKEKFHLPYGSVLVVSPQSKKVTSNTGNIIRSVPLAGSALGGLIKEKWRYLVVHFDDPDVEAAKGVVNFKLGNKELLDAVIRSLAAKADLTQRGDAFYRPKKSRNEL